MSQQFKFLSHQKCNGTFNKMEKSSTIQPCRCYNIEKLYPGMTNCIDLI
eukprot:UN07685